MTGRPLVTPFRSEQEVITGLPLAIDALRRGGLLAYPTETVYGLGGGTDAGPVEAVLRLKGRDAGKAVLVLVSDLEMVEKLGLRLSGAAAAVASAHWPGPVTLVLPATSADLPPGLRGPSGGVAVRWTSHEGLRLLIASFGAPITSTSANRPGAAPAATAEQVIRDWADSVRAGRLYVLDGGPLAPSAPSTVLDCTGARPRIIRRGAISAARLRESVPDLVEG